MKIEAGYLYDKHSESGLALLKELGVKQVSHENSKFKGDPAKVIVNWGCSDLPRQIRACLVINPENGIRQAVNKLRAFTVLAKVPGINLPRWTTDINEAREFKGKVYCRTKLTGHDGDGIVLATAPQCVAAKLYTEQIGDPKDCAEYRINIFRDETVTRQKKVKVKGKDKYNDEIKTTDGGYGFDVVDLVPNGVIPAARLAVRSLGLDFGGVDIIVYRAKAYVLEVNTAPQLTPLTCKRLAELIKGA